MLPHSGPIHQPTSEATSIRVLQNLGTNQMGGAGHNVEKYLAQVSYLIRMADANAHLLSVTVFVKSEKMLETLILFMPVWTPGSYLVREYSRHVEQVEAFDGAKKCPVQKVAKNRWSVECGEATEITVTYLLYCNDLTVRTNHINTSHIYFNGAATYLIPIGNCHKRANGSIDDSCEYGVDVDLVGDFRIMIDVPDSWSIATSLPQVETAPGAVRCYLAEDLDSLLDSPFECGVMTSRSFSSDGINHHLAVWQNSHSEGVDWDKVVADTKKIVDTEARLTGNDLPECERLPRSDYWFIWHVVNRGRGGLEHMDNCSLLVSSTGFSSRLGYLDSLSLVAHEYLHRWNVKRVRPAGLVPYRYEEENYTRQLWWFEGGTSYFDWRILRLSGLASAAEYGRHLADVFCRVTDTPGASVHCLADASFDAWVKAYRPDENSVNSTISYYVKGEAVCALLDIVLRIRSGGNHHLDEVLRYLIRNHGVNNPVPEHTGAMSEVIRAASGVDVSDVLHRWVYTTQPLDEQRWLSEIGLRWVRVSGRGPSVSIGARLKSAEDGVRIDNLLRAGPAMLAGLERDDEILAIDRRRVDEVSWDNTLESYRPGDEVTVLFARDRRVQTVKLTLAKANLKPGFLKLNADATPLQRKLLAGWLGADAIEALRKVD